MSDADNHDGSQPNSPRRAGPTIDLTAKEIKADAAGSEHDSVSEPDQAPGPGHRDFKLWPVLTGAATAAIVAFPLGFGASHFFTPSGDQDARLAALEARVAAQPEETVGPQPDTALLGRLTALEAAGKAAANEAASGKQQIEEITGQIREARARADAAADAAQKAQQLGTRDTAADSANATTIAALEKRLDTAEKSFAQVEKGLAAVESRATERNEAAVQPDQKGRAAIAALALANAVNGGRPFTQEFEVAKPLIGDPRLLAALQPFAETGVPQAAHLARDLSGLSAALTEAAAPQTRSETGFLDKLQANASKLVRITPVGEAAGDEPVNVIARIKAKAAQSDLSGALEELAKLPPQVRSPAASWITRVEARNAAIAAAHQVLVSALTALKSDT